MSRGLGLVVAMFLLGVFAACSDDSSEKKDGGTLIDKGPAKDKGPTVDKGPTADKGPAKDTAPTADMSSIEIAKQEAITFIKALANKLPAPGGTPEKVEKYVPADNEVPGWVEDPSKPAGVQAGYTKEEIVALIDGHQDPFDAKGCDGYAKQDYMKGSMKMILEVWDMTSASGAMDMFNYEKTDRETQAGLTYEIIPNAGDATAIAHDEPKWRAHCAKGEYIFNLKTYY